MKRVLACLAMLLLFGSMLTTPATASTAVPPADPVSADGRKLPGQWFGPFTYRNQHSGKCLDLSYAGLGASVVQNSCIAGKASQAWYVWQYKGDGFISFVLFGNGAGGTGCASGIYARSGLFTKGCAENEDQTWYRTSDRLNEYFNEMTGLCMEVGGWSKADGATVMTWDCLHNPNQVWFRWDWY